MPLIEYSVDERYTNRGLLGVVLLIYMCVTMVSNCNAALEGCSSLLADRLLPIAMQRVPLHLDDSVLAVMPSHVHIEYTR